MQATSNSPVDSERPAEKSSHKERRNYRINSRSCIACHRRKVRCDRGVPCTNCSRYNFTCMYPKEKTEKRELSLQSLSERLERVESLLARFCEAQLSESAGQVGGHVEHVEVGNQRHSEMNQVQVSSSGRSKSSWEVLLNDGNAVQYVNNPNIKDLLQDVCISSDSVLHEEFNLIDKQDDKMRIPQKIADTSPLARERRTIMNSNPTRPTTAFSTSSPSTKPSPHLVQQPTQPTNILELYPNPELALQLWSTYTKCVDPVMKFLHIPTTQSSMVSTILDPKSANRSILALSFAIFYAAITALCQTRTSTISKSERKSLLQNYKYALDTLLLSTNLMNTPDLTSLQALTIYALALHDLKSKGISKAKGTYQAIVTNIQPKTTYRVHTSTRSTWVLTGLLIRLAHSIGLHRNGLDLKLTPFETELRLRLWWHICVLDSRAPENQGFEVSVDVPQVNRDLRLPLNVDDECIFPGMRDFPVESAGWTEMSFSLIQTESCQLLSPVLGCDGNGIRNGNGNGSGYGEGQSEAEAIMAKRSFIRERMVMISERVGLNSDGVFGPDSDNSNSRANRKIKENLTLNETHRGTSIADAILPRIAIQHLTTATKKMEFILQLREEILTGVTNSQSCMTRSFGLACDALESNRRLLSTEFSGDYRWLFTTYTQWYALAYVLRCLCTSSVSCGGREERERAWELVEDVFPDMGCDDGGEEMEMERQGCIWTCLVRLRQQALALRERERGIGTSLAGGDLNGKMNVMDMDFDNDLDLPTLGDEDFDAFSGFATNLPFLPEWNAVIHGCFDEMGESIQG